jgi:hypothetical protein
MFQSYQQRAVTYNIATLLHSQDSVGPTGLYDSQNWELKTEFGIGCFVATSVEDGDEGGSSFMCGVFFHGFEVRTGKTSACPYYHGAWCECVSNN